MAFAESYQKICAELVELSQGAAPRLIAITKYASDEQVLEAYKLGIRDFGENYVLAALERITKLRALMPEAKWHLTGHLQKNKVNKVVGKFDYIQSVDSLELAALIAKRAESLGIEQKILLQINISGEESKSGFKPELISAELPKLLQLKGLKIEGLMTMAPSSVSEELTVKVFADLRELRDQLSREHNCPLEHLSMGMSNDYALAISQGSTMIRLGRALFKA